MTQGFVTIATGHERYYQMARNLLRSYRQTCAEPMKFAVIADQHNEYTEEFDDVVILEHPTRSWMDKVQLLENCPYDETIFIDADCLIYRDINGVWEKFRGADDFSCFGKVLPMDSTEGWFRAEASKSYPIHFITHLHGMMYFVRRGEGIKKMNEVCQKIINDYNSVSFKAFNDKMADEPIFALAMAIMDFKPIERTPSDYCFVPYATRLRTDYYTKNVTFSNPKDGDVNGCGIVHWGNVNTTKYQYRCDAQILNDFEAEKQGDSHGGLYRMFCYKLGLLRFGYHMQDRYRDALKQKDWVIERVRVKMGRG